MTRRKKPKNKTIVKEAIKHISAKQEVYDAPRLLENFHGDDPYYQFIFPNDLDKIQPDPINGNLTIKFPD